MNRINSTLFQLSSTQLQFLAFHFKDYIPLDMGYVLNIQHGVKNIIRILSKDLSFLLEFC